jgi:hypothetical protein
MKHISPQLGFNNNVRHKGRVFHIQTEDSGVKHPHVITHLFADGGRILKSTKTSYAEFLGEEELAKKVRSLMQEQHKAMFIALRGGKFDHMFPEDAAAEGAPPAGGSSPGANEPKPDAAAKPPSAEREAVPPEAAPPIASQPAPHEPEPAQELPAQELPAQELAPEPEQPAPSASGANPAERPPEPPPRSAPTSSPDPRSEESPRSSESRPILSALASQPQAPLSRSRLTPPPPKRDLGKPTDPRRSEVPTRTGAPPSGPRSGPRPLEPRSVEPFAPTMPGLDAIQPSGVGEPTQAQERSSGAAPGSRRSPSAPPPRATLSESLELDLEALERAAEQTNSPVYQQLRDLPPPPATLLRGTTNRQTAYRSLTPQAPQLIKEPAQPPPKPPSKPQAKPVAATEISADRRVDRDHRYAHSRPASIFGPTRPQEGSNIFGEDLISEKSLDEVILSYLAEDLDPTAKK